MFVGGRAPHALLAALGRDRAGTALLGRRRVSRGEEEETQRAQHIGAKRLLG